MLNSKWSSSDCDVYSKLECSPVSVDGRDAVTGPVLWYEIKPKLTGSLLLPVQHAAPKPIQTVPFLSQCSHSTKWDKKGFSL